MTVLGEGGDAYFRGGAYFLDSLASVEKGAYFRGGAYFRDFTVFSIIYITVKLCHEKSTTTQHLLKHL